MGCVSLLLPWRILAHPTLIKFWCVGGVLLSHNPTIAVPSAQSSLATGIGTGPGVPSTLKPPTQTHETNHPKRVCCVKHCTTNTNTILFSIFAANILFPAQSIFMSPTHSKRGFLCRCISTSHLQHVTMLTALAYQPHHLQGTSIETSSQNRLPA